MFGLKSFVSRSKAVMLGIGLILALAGPVGMFQDGSALASNAGPGDAQGTTTEEQATSPDGHDVAAEGHGVEASGGLGGSVVAFTTEDYTARTHNKGVEGSTGILRIIIISLIVLVVLVGFIVLQARKVADSHVEYHMTVAAKLAIFFSILVALLTFTGMFSLKAIQKGGLDIDEVAMVLAPLSYHLGDIETGIVEQQLAMSEAIMAVSDNEPESFQALLEEYVELDGHINTEFDNLTAKLVEYPAPTKAIAAMVSEELNKVEGLRVEYVELHREAAIVFGHLEDGEIESAEEALHELEVVAKIADAELMAFRSEVNDKFDVLEVEAAQYEFRVILPIITIIIVAVVLGLVIALLASSMVVKPIEMLAGAAHTMSTGDFSIILPHNKAKDAIAKMTESFIEMKNNTKHLIEQVVEVANSVASASEELSASADETGKGIQEVAMTVNEVAKGGQETTTIVCQSQGNLSQTSTAIEGISKEIEEVAAYATQAAAQGEEGRTATDEAVGLINRAAASVQETTNVMHNLGDKTNQISEFISIITGIADQTNLLALNAAIEAARAGEAGRGFAVVAEEVRKLAEESNTAAGSITSLVKGIEVEMQSALSAMEKSDKEVSEGARTVGLASNMLGEIVGGVQTLNDKVQNISASAEEINASTSEVVTVMQSVGATAEENAAASEEVAASTEEQTAAMGEIASSAHQLADLAQGLQEVIGKFRV